MAVVSKSIARQHRDFHLEVARVSVKFGQWDVAESALNAAARFQSHIGPNNCKRYQHLSRCCVHREIHL